MAEPILVRALARGYYGRLRERDDRFEVASEQDLGRWMQRIEPTPEAPADEAPDRRPPARVSRRTAG